MNVESYEKQVENSCRKCYTIFDLKRDYCCVKGDKECFADLGLVKKGIIQDKALRLKLFKKSKIDEDGKIINRVFYRGIFRNECLVFNYRPPGCRSHFCDMWDKYIKKYPMDMVYANLKISSLGTLKKNFRKDYELGIKMAYPGGYIIYTDKPAKIRKELGSILDELKIRHFKTDAEKMIPDDNKKPGVEFIMDIDGIVEKPRLFGTIIKNNMFMLVRMKMNMGSTGFNHANVYITTADPESIAKETPGSLKSFYSLLAYKL